MRIGVLVGKRPDGKFECIKAGHDIQIMKEELKKIKVDEENLPYEAAYLLVDPVKKVKLKKSTKVKELPKRTKKKSE